MIAARLSTVKLGVISAVSLTAAAAAPFLIGSNGLDMADLAPTQRLMAMLDGRSPGERVEGNLVATKVKPAAKASVAPRQRALGKVVTPTTLPPQEFVDALTPPAPAEVAFAGVPAIADVIAPPPPAFATGPSGPSLVGGGGGGGGGGSPGTPGNPVLPETPTISAAVPEPSTWLMMLLGFGVIGRAVRRNRAAVVARSSFV